MRDRTCTKPAHYMVPLEEGRCSSPEARAADLNCAVGRTSPATPARAGSLSEPFIHNDQRPEAEARGARAQVPSSLLSPAVRSNAKNALQVLSCVGLRTRSGSRHFTRCSAATSAGYSMPVGMRRTLPMQMETLALTFGNSDARVASPPFPRTSSDTMVARRRFASRSALITPKLHNAILSLHRDDPLRRAYIRRRWIESNGRNVVSGWRGRV